MTDVTADYRLGVGTGTRHDEIEPPRAASLQGDDVVRLRKPMVALVALVSLTALVSCQPVPRTARTIPPPKFGAPGNVITGALGSVLNPMRNPDGANNYSCKPSAAHPNPVILVHGTLGNAYDSFSGMAPALKSFGYCVFAVNYGASSGKLFKGTGDIPTSAAEIGRFVDGVLDRHRRRRRSTSSGTRRAARWLATTPT